MSHNNKLRILQIGVGSMGTRRLRDLSSRADVVLAAVDTRPDRRKKVTESWAIPVFETFEEALAWEPQAICISTPPDEHERYIRQAMQLGLHHFCEANIWIRQWRQIEKSQGLICAPSCTFYFHPLVQSLKTLVNNSLGTMHTWQYCLSTYMPDWHPNEGNEFYARHRSTAAAREMVPFELLWLHDAFGFTANVSATVRQLANLGKDLEDTWSLQCTLESGAIAQFTVLMGCPAVCRRGWCLGENGMLEFDLEKGILNLMLSNHETSTQSFGTQSELIENIYRQEINAFVDAIYGRASWPLSYTNANRACAVLAAAEVSSLSAMEIAVDVDRQPALIPTDYSIAQVDSQLHSNGRRDRLVGA